MSVVSYSELARELGIAPRAISDFVYRGILDPSDWPKVAGRHVIPRDDVPRVVQILRERGVLTETEAAAS
ncbi:MAG: hypothetical protein WD894_05010 [Pirellulales bacterium]